MFAMNLVGEPTFIAKKGLYRLYVQKGTFHGRTVFMSSVKSEGSMQNGKFCDTFEEAEVAGKADLIEVYEEGERSYKEFERQQIILRIKRFFLNFLPKPLRETWISKRNKS